MYLTHHKNDDSFYLCEHVLKKTPHFYLSFATFVNILACHRRGIITGKYKSHSRKFHSRVASNFHACIVNKMSRLSSVKKSAKEIMPADVRGESALKLQDPFANLRSSESITTKECAVRDEW